LQRDDERESDFDADYQRQPILAITRLLKSEGAVVICRRGLVKEGFCGKKTGASGRPASVSSSVRDLDRVAGGANTGKTTNSLFPLYRSGTRRGLNLGRVLRENPVI